MCRNQKRCKAPAWGWTFGCARKTCWLGGEARQLQVAFALLNGIADGCSRGNKQGDKTKYPVVWARAFAAANGKLRGVRTAGVQFGGRRERVSTDDLGLGGSEVQEQRSASSSRVKKGLKSKPLIRFGIRKNRAKLATVSLAIFPKTTRSHWK